MAATAQDIKDFFALSGNNPPVTNGQLSDVGYWLKEVTDGSGGADELVDYIYKTLKYQVIAHKRRKQIVTF